MEIITAGIAVVAFAAVVFTLVGTVNRRRRPVPRIVWHPQGEPWLTLDEVAALLEVGRGEILNLVEREGIPYWVAPRGARDQADELVFRRDEIEEWTI